MTDIQIREIRTDALAVYASIPISFMVESVFRIRPLDGGLGGMTLTEEPLEHPYVKDYDANPEEGVVSWGRRFDVSHWLFLVAFDSDVAVGGAAVAMRSPDVHMLQGREGLAVLWDIRVRHDRRGRGIGSALFRRAIKWALGQGCTQLKIETQNTNVPACRFYAGQGCRLVAIDCYAYASAPRVADEAMLVWRLDLRACKAVSCK
jgi:GNAT superfamily N-acetyltransferase